MIYSVRSKVLIPTPTKTGSHSINKYLIDNNLIDFSTDSVSVGLSYKYGTHASSDSWGKLITLNELSNSMSRHTTLQDAVSAGVVQISEIEDFLKMGFIRHPVDRWVSAACFSLSLRGIIPTTESVSDIFNGKIVPIQSILTRPQVDWFSVDGEILCDLYPLKDMHSVVTSSLLKNKSDPEHVHENRSSRSGIHLSERTKESIIELYEEDYTLYNRVATGGL